MLFLFHLCTIFGITYASTYDVNFNETGREFNGIGALSAGASSRLLIDYPEPSRSQILDYLFLPSFGASLQILKIEIGGDTWSTCGTEPSHMHNSNSTDSNYNRGYEWWLSIEAKKRNPNIKIYALPWGFPSWIGNGALNENMANYVVNFVIGAQKYHNLTIDYLGIWNEDSWSVDYVITLYNKLKEYKLENVTRLVVADNFVSNVNVLLNQIDTNTTFSNAFDIIGVHYPPSSESTLNMSLSKKILWSSEDSSSNDNLIGAGCWARILNWNYVYGNYTSTIMWPIISSWYEYLAYYGDGLMTAATPWVGNENNNNANGGYYIVKAPLYITAHTTQFVDILNGDKWNYIKQNKGSGILKYGGSYVTLKSMNTGMNFTIVIETMEYQQSLCIRDNPANPWKVETQNITFNLNFLIAADGDDDKNNNNSVKLPNSLFFWKSLLKNDSSNSDASNVSMVFIQQNDIDIDYDSNSGIYSVSLLNIEPNSVITLTTMNTGKRGSYPTPKLNKSDEIKFPIPYSDNFDSYIDKFNGGYEIQPKYFSDQAGSFAIALRKQTEKYKNGQKNNKIAKTTDTTDTTDRTDSTDLAFEQVALASPSQNNTGWHNSDALQPITIIGSYNLTNYTVFVEAWMPDCISSGNSNSCNIVVGLRLGGALSSKGCGGAPRENVCVQAIGSNWYDYGYFLQIYNNGLWKVLIGNTNSSLISGNVSQSLVNNVWFNVTFGINDKYQVEASLNDENLFEPVMDEKQTFASGWPGLGCGWHTCQFDTFKLY